MTLRDEPFTVSESDVLVQDSTTTQIEIDGRISTYSTQTLQVVALNETASSVWRACDGVRTVAAVVEELSLVYGEPPARIHAEVVASLNELVRQQLLRPVTKS